jgi:hypothetical protein
MTLPPNSPHKIMTMRPVSAKQGALWIRQGFSVFMTCPLLFSCLLGFMLISMLFLVQIPWLGGLIFLTNLPLFSLSFMLLSQQALNKQPASIGVYFSLLHVGRARARSLLILGLLYATSTLGILALCHMIDGGKFYALQMAMTTPGITPEEVQKHLADPQLQQGVLLCAVLLTLRTLTFWHTPALVYWAGYGVSKALFFNFISVWRSKAAFAIYALMASALLISLEFLSGLLVAVLGTPQLAVMVVIPVSMAFVCVLYASVFFTFADSFEAHVTQ